MLAVGLGLHHSIARPFAKQFSTWVFCTLGWGELTRREPHGQRLVNHSLTVIELPRISSAEHCWYTDSIVYNDIDGVT